MKQCSCSNDENNFPDKLILTRTQVSRLCKAFANGLSAKIKLSKAQLHKIERSGEFLSSPLGPLLKTGLSLMKNVLKPLVKTVLIPLGIAAAASATDSTIRKKGVQIWCASFLLSFVYDLKISNEKMNDIMKLVKSLEEPSLLMKGISETIKNEPKEQKGEFLEGVLLEHLLTIKGTIRPGEGTIRACENF